MPWQEQYHMRHKTARAYARALEVIGWVVAILGAISGIVTMYQVSVAAGLGYLLGAVASGFGMVVLGELVLVFINIEYNTMFLRNLAEKPAPQPGFMPANATTTETGPKPPLQ